MPAAGSAAARPREHLAAAALALACGAAYVLTSVLRHRHFDSSLDLSIFDQAVWHLSRFEPPASSIRGFTNLFGDHFHPVIALLAPLYWIAPAAETLLVGQSFVLAASIVPVFLFLRTRLPFAAALMLSAAYGLFWGLQRAANFDFHELAFAPLIVATAILAMDRRQWWLFWTASLMLVLVKEDMIPLLGAFGALLVLEGERLRGAALAVFSVVAFYVVLRVIVPALADANYNYLVAYGDSVRRPWEIPLQLVSPPAKLMTMLMWLAPFAFLPLRSRYLLLLLPLALERFLSSSPNHWGTSFHYSAPVAPILAMSAADGLARLSASIASPLARGRVVVGFAIATLLLSSLLPGRQPHWKLLSPKHYASLPSSAAAARALRVIPRAASLAAQSPIAPHLSQRDTMYILEEGAPDTDYVVASRHVAAWPAASYADIERLIEQRRQRGYRVVFDEDGWLVLKRGPDTP